MADKKIEDATPDIDVTGIEKLPVSDNGVAKCMTVSQVKDYVLAQIAAITAASGIDLTTDGVYLLKGGAMKPLSASDLASAVLEYGFGKTAVSSINSNVKVGVKDNTTQNTITIGALKTWLEANMSVPAVLDIDSLATAGELSSTDNLVVSQSGTNKKLTITTYAAYVHAAFKAYVTGLTAVTNLTDNDVLYIINGSEAKKCTIAQMKTLIGAGDVTSPATTTAGKIPKWDSTNKKLADGFSVASQISSDSPSADKIPTEAAVATAVGNCVVKVTGKGLSKNDYTDEEKAKVAALADAALAPWVASKTYAVGDYCVYGGFIRRCITAGSATTFNPEWWEYTPSYPTTDATSKYLRGDGTWAIPPTSSVFTGATSVANGTSGLVPAPLMIDKDKFLKADGTWVAIDGSSDMTGATASAAGVHGLAPAPAAGDNAKFLRGDATWVAITDMGGATDSIAGSHGLVPAPAAGDQDKYLKGDGSWATVSSGSKMPLVEVVPALNVYNIQVDKVNLIYIDENNTTVTISPTGYSTAATLYQGYIMVFNESESTTPTVSLSFSEGGYGLPEGYTTLASLFAPGYRVIRFSLINDVEESTSGLLILSFDSVSELTMLDS